MILRETGDLGCEFKYLSNQFITIVKGNFFILCQTLYLFRRTLNYMFCKTRIYNI